LRLPGLNCFEGAFCDDSEGRLAAFLVALPAAFLPDLLALVRRPFDDSVFAGFPGFAPAATREAVFEDFLRVFLDIRLPFVAFGGSIKGIASLVRANWDSAAGQV
jgi:hypothetical protein